MTDILRELEKPGPDPRPAFKAAVVTDQLWVADITSIAIAAAFVYLAAILDAWSRRVVGYAISRSMDARLAIAALKVALRARQPPKGCIHHSDPGAQYACEAYRRLLADYGLVGSALNGAYDSSRLPVLSDAQVQRVSPL